MSLSRPHRRLFNRPVLVKWVRENLFSNWINSILTILSIYFVAKIILASHSLDVERGLDHKQPARMPGSLARHQWRMLVGFGRTLEPNVVWLPISGRSLLAPDPGLCVAFGLHRSGFVPKIATQDADLFRDLPLSGLLVDLGRNTFDPRVVVASHSLRVIWPSSKRSA